MKMLFKVLGVCLLIQSAFGVVKQFNQADFENALKENKRIVISVKAIWCGHCIAQQSVFKEISSYPPYSDCSSYSADACSSSAHLCSSSSSPQSCYSASRCSTYVCSSSFSYSSSSDYS